MQEPIITWNLLLTLVIIPVGLFMLFQGIKRLFAKKDKEDTRKDEIIADLVRSKECAQKRELELTHGAISEQLKDLRHYTETQNGILFDKLEGIYRQLKTANSRTSKLETNLGALKAVHDEIHKSDRRWTDKMYESETEL